MTAPHREQEGLEKGMRHEMKDPAEKAPTPTPMIM